MFNRGCKLTALLVAAAATLTMVPASAATRLETKDGSFDNAIAFNGKYVYDGYKTIDDEDSETAVYFSTGSKDTAIDNHDDYTFKFDKKYGEKYILAEDSGDYLLDLSTGKIEDSETVEDKQDAAARNLKNALKRTDRYDNNNVAVETSNLTLVPNNKFGKVWYSYEVNGFKGFTDASGYYIDVCNLANLYVAKTTESSSELVKLEEYGKENKGLTAELQSIKVLAQDDSNFYTLTEVKITGEGAPEDNLKYLQKISKKQGETKDDAYLPKDVVSYEITNKFDADDAKDAVDVITASDAEIVVNSGIVYAIQKTKDTEIKVTKFKLKKEKAALIGQSNKLDVQLVEKDDDETHDITSGSEYTLDVDGNVWGINKGKIFQMKGLTATDVYTCDNSFTKLSVYNDKNLVVWEDENYAAVVNGSQTDSTVSGGSTDTNTSGDSTSGGSTSGTTTGTTETTGTTTTTGTTAGTTTTTGTSTTTTQNGWVKNADGTWSFYKNNTQVKGQWVQDGAWYYIKADGIMATGWLQDGSTWYYLNGSGAMQTGWLNDGGTWYYLQTSGAMATGWLNDNGTWYYLNESGAMLANTTVDGYKLGASGAWIK